MICKRAFSHIVCIVPALLCVNTSVVAQNAVSNPGFEQVGPNGTSTSFTGIQYGGFSAAADWTVWNNTPVTTLTDLVPSTDTLAPGGNYMLHVNTGGSDNGLYQGFNLVTPAYASADVYVTSGQVQLSLVATGGYPTATVSTALNTWQHLSFSLLGGSDEVIIYSKGGSANFYVDNVSVTPTPTSSVPEANTFLIAGIGLFAAVQCRRKRFGNQYVSSTGDTSA